MLPKETNPDQGANPMRSTLRSRTPMLIGAGLSVLIHALAFWFVTSRMQSLLEPPPFPSEKRLTVSLAAPVKNAPPQQSAPPASEPRPPQETAPTAKRKPPSKPALAQKREKKAVPVITAQTEPSPTAPPAKPRPPADDMLTMLEAARKRRAEAQADMPEQSNAPADARDNSIALANIATSLKQAKRADQAETGGVFQIRRLGYRDAEVLFRGWSTDFNRNRTRVIEVERGAEIDIQTAVVKKMIELIREERSGDFIWDSHRLGRQFKLSARPQDSAELQQFLLKEFFPEYQRGAPRG